MGILSDIDGILGKMGGYHPEYLYAHRENNICGEFSSTPNNTLLRGPDGKEVYSPHILAFPYPCHVYHLYEAFWSIPITMPDGSGKIVVHITAYPFQPDKDSTDYR